MANVLRAVAAGARVQVTSRGVPVAVLSPVEQGLLSKLTLREGTGVMEFPRGVTSEVATSDVLAELRGTTVWEP